jgi:hypothetical protein
MPAVISAHSPTAANAAETCRSTARQRTTRLRRLWPFDHRPATGERFIPLFRATSLLVVPGLARRRTGKDTLGQLILSLLHRTH